MSSPETLYGPDRSILITGASSGIGAALARELGPHGGKLALMARRRDRLEALASEVAGLGARPLVLEGDVRDGECVKALHRELVLAQGPVDVAFLNAGVPGTSSLARFDAARVRSTFEVNVFGVANWLDVLLPDMISRAQGVLAITGSLAGARGLPGFGAYAASKAAVTILWESLRPEARAHGLQLSLVEPGFIKSEMTARHPFKMPWLLETADAAARIARAVADGDEHIRFPWQMVGAIEVLRNLPDPLFKQIGRAMTKKR